MENPSSTCELSCEDFGCLVDKSLATLHRLLTREAVAELSDPKNKRRSCSLPKDDMSVVIHPTERAYRVLVILKKWSLSEVQREDFLATMKAQLRNTYGEFQASVSADKTPIFAFEAIAA